MSVSRENQAGNTIRRADVATVLFCKSGNPHLGLLLTAQADGLIVGLPDGPHAPDSVAVRLGHQQCAVLAELAARAAANPGQRDGGVEEANVQALERAYQARRGALFDREHGRGWCVGCGRNPVCAQDGYDTCPTCLESC